MRQSRIGEFELIRSLRRATVIPHGVEASVLTGIGDDAAILKPRPGRVILATTDLLAERIHFNLTFTSYRQLGYKAAMASLSDIAAMGGAPRFLLIALALPPRKTPRDVERSMRESVRRATRPGWQWSAGTHPPLAPTCSWP